MIQFNERDSDACFSCMLRKPEFRVIWIERVPSKDRSLKPSCGDALFCRRCLKTTLNDFHKSYPQCKIPLSDDETEKLSLVRQLGLLVIPIAISTEEQRVLLNHLQFDEIQSSRKNRNRAIWLN